MTGAEQNRIRRLQRRLDLLLHACRRGGRRCWAPGTKGQRSPVGTCECLPCAVERIFQDEKKDQEARKCAVT